MTTSQNGWPASPNAGLIDVGNPTCPGTTVKFPGGVRNGDVTTVLMYVAEQINEHVAPLHAGWCWGYDYKNVEGDTDLSNHASGTAIDINAPAHPMGVKGTWTGTQVHTIHGILSQLDSAVRWGGDYTGRVDEMHFEINAGADSVHKVANKILAAKPVPPVVHRTYEVLSGDTLTGIAKKFNVKGGWEALYTANRKVIGSNPNAIVPGQVLVV